MFQRSEDEEQNCKIAQTYRYMHFLNPQMCLKICARDIQWIKYQTVRHKKEEDGMVVWIVKVCINPEAHLMAMIP